MMKKVVIKNINNYDYTLVDEDNNVYIINIEFYSKYKPVIFDIIHISENILNTKNLYAFDEITNIDSIITDDIIKIIHKNQVYFFQRRYG